MTARGAKVVITLLTDGARNVWPNLSGDDGFLRSPSRTLVVSVFSTNRAAGGVGYRYKHSSPEATIPQKTSGSPPPPSDPLISESFHSRG